MSTRFESKPDTLEDVAVDEPEDAEPSVDESTSVDEQNADDPVSTDDPALSERDSEERFVPSPVPRAGAQEPRRPWRPRSRGVARTIVITVVVAVLLAVACGVLWLTSAGYAEQQERDRAITVAARTEVLSLLTLSPETVQQSFDKVLAGSTGTWRDEFARQSDQFSQTVRNGQVRSTATITGSGLQQADDHHARAMVAASSQIKNSDNPNGYPGSYRILLDLEQRDGRWLVSDLKFVP